MAVVVNLNPDHGAVVVAAECCQKASEYVGPPLAARLHASRCGSAQVRCEGTATGLVLGGPMMRWQPRCEL